MLTIKSLSVSYGRVPALKDVSLTVPEGQVVALIGSNGAGKTTLMNAVSGLLRPTAGSVLFAGSDITSEPAYRVARLGLNHVPEGRRMLGDLSVIENLSVGRLARGERQDEADNEMQIIFEMFPILWERRQQPSGSLSGGQQQMLAIGRALMAKPRLLMLDEPSLGLAPLIVSQVFDALSELNRRGLTILVVEQNARRALRLSSYAYVLENGAIAQEGQSNDLVDDPRIVDHYLGSGH